MKTCRIMEGMSVETASREEYLRRGRRLEYFTIAYNSLEGVCSIVAGLIAGSRRTSRKRLLSMRMMAAYA